MFYSFLFISILVFTTNAAISDIATVGGITGYPAIVYTKGQANTANDIYDSLYRNAVFSTLSTIYGLEGTTYSCKFYFLTPTTLGYRPTLEYYRSATEKVTYDKDFITQDMINFVIRLAEKTVVKLDTAVKYTQFLSSGNYYNAIIYFSSTVLSTTDSNIVTLASLGAVFDNVLIACAWDSAVLTAAGVTAPKLRFYRVGEDPLDYTPATLVYNDVYNWIEEQSYLNALNFNQNSQEIVLHRDKNVIFFLYSDETTPASPAFKQFRQLAYTKKSSGVIFCYSKKDETNIFYNSLAYYLGQNNAATFPQVVFTKKRVKYYYDQTLKGAISTATLTTFIDDILQTIPQTTIFYKSEPVPTYQSSIVEKVVGTNYQSVCIDSLGTTCVIYCRRHTCYDFISIYEAVAKKVSFKIYYLDLDFNEIPDITLNPDQQQRFICYKQSAKTTKIEFTSTTYDEPTLTSFVSTNTRILQDL